MVTSLCEPQNCWVTYFDILGFKNLIKKYANALDIVFGIYKEILQELEARSQPYKEYGLNYQWFSDAFLIFTSDDSSKSFCIIEQASRLFFQKMIYKDIPLRGALTVGWFYGSKEDNIFIGPALIDAYKYAENQNWLGFILTPMSDKRLNELGYYHRSNYTTQGIPMKSKEKKKGIYAYTMNLGPANYDSPFLSHIHQMKQEALKNCEEYEKHKINKKKQGALKKIEKMYEKTGKFIIKHHKRI